MPDGDRFYRRLIGTGRGWGSAYRIACNNGNTIFLKDRALKAIADNLRRISPDSMETVIGILHKSFDEEKWQKRGFSVSVGDVFVGLERDLNISRLDGDFNLVKIMEMSAKKIFLASRNSSLSITEEEINERFGQTLAVEIMDSRFLSRIRDGIMEKQNRTFSEQIKWEQDLRKEILEPAKKLVKGFLNGKQIKKFRSPVVRRNDRNATSNILNRSLNILPPI